MQTLWQNKSITTEKIDLSAFGINDCSLYLRREDLLHPFVSGNKFRKLKYNIEAAQLQKHDTLLTFGGAFSNHIAAVAAAGKELGLKTIGIIRGEELKGKVDENPTLSFAQNCGMQLHFASRELYREKESLKFKDDLRKLFGDFYLLPEGGTNSLAIKGCEEILKKEDAVYDYICVPVGTGGTISGLINASKHNQTVLGFSALKGTFQTSEISKHTSKMNFEIIDSYCFGGYGKIDIDLVRFINEFRLKTRIPLDPVYTGKMIYGILDLLKKGYFMENSCILAVHTGGLQGVPGMNKLLLKKQLPLIE
ncbi:1-aminocyclopropane-1-carboxylate deaminase/D-cysteine desulfhydrase [Aequorivita viscosa]|uniref:1-aminocyclopropane-1-carboxylate deaminase n=1 Tax=Aequorivita viscosa TaxID=797419 RepID=A0A1M6E0F1_9FLAO|nr:pyridoxal-phosphate dependent enzyme [Aequorivita viscosa]SDW47269.1 1-aminocyclopropane-1-carboxylate deaminase [Aequorivita viscosa]SHI78748.1 1-aminocyclopropane-1-carboxylate deaminase [Aequorivita viscosa]